MTSKPAGRSLSSRVKSFGSLESTSSEMLNYSGWWFSSLRFFRFLRGGLLSNYKCLFSLGAANPQMGLGRLFIAGEQTQVKGHKCPCTKLPSCPPFGPLAGQVPALLTQHITRSKVFSLFSFFRKTALAVS